jgi:hypothetical protein
MTSIWAVVFLQIRPVFSKHEVRTFEKTRRFCIAVTLAKRSLILKKACQNGGFAKQSFTRRRVKRVLFFAVFLSKVEAVKQRHDTCSMRQINPDFESMSGKPVRNRANKAFCADVGEKGA